MDALSSISSVLNKFHHTHFLFLSISPFKIHSFFLSFSCAAHSLGLPYLEPYLGFKNGALKPANTEQGMNFAVAGASALDRGFFEEKGFAVEATANFSLRVQLDWFKEFLPSLCASSSSEVTFSFLLLH